MFKLEILNEDTSIYWREHFNNIESLFNWLEEEKTRPYFKKEFNWKIYSKTLNKTLIKKSGEYPLSSLNETELDSEISRVTHKKEGLEEIPLEDPIIKIPDQYLDKEIIIVESPEEIEEKEKHKNRKKKIKDLIDKEVLDSDDIQKALKILLKGL